MKKLDYPDKTNGTRWAAEARRLDRAFAEGYSSEL